jgi:predicted dinucleotide-binding enzyme
MLVAGDDAARKPVVMELVGMLGFVPVDAEAQSIRRVPFV